MTLVVMSVLKKTEWKHKNRIKMLAQRKLYREANKDKQQKYFKKYRLTHLDKEVIRNRNWVLNNRDKKRVKDSIRRARLKNVNDIKTSEDRKLLATMYKTALSYEVKTGFAWHIDHIVPLSKRGRHCLTNLQIVPARWNQSKGNRNELRFIFAT